MFIEVIGGSFINTDYVVEMGIEPRSSEKDSTWDVVLTRTDGDKEVLYHRGVYDMGYVDADKAMVALRDLAHKLNKERRC